VAGVKCYKCQTLMATRISTHLGSTSTDPLDCVHFAAANILEKDAKFEEECIEGCLLAVDISETVDASGNAYQLGVELRSCSNDTKLINMSVCLESVPFLQVLGDKGQAFLSSKGLQVPTEPGMKLCGCDVDYCNLDLNTILYYPDHVKLKEKQDKEKSRKAKEDEADEEARRKNCGRLNVRMNKWMMLFIIGSYFIIL